jgi:homopolymeric O-antigen transport system ATP-binding protein
MGSNAIIRVEGLGKKYVIGHERQRQHLSTLRDALVGKGKNFARTLKETARGRPLVAGDKTESFWALKDVSFEVKEGEVVGIIGRNGAGKSTLLKVLSRITEPSEGRVTIRGRVGSLLEVGTGFHPELTGRENIFLNGAILGMTRVEIRQKFDEIVAFAGVERFLDTPVKRYSSGMYVRLAFAVAAHLEPKILIVDEVLAVGDVEFQKKCLGKMSEVASTGRTVLFVSHNLEAVRRICMTGLFLSAGRLELRGSADQCVDSYLSRSLHSLHGHVAHKIEFPTKGKDSPHIVRIEILDKTGQPLPRPRTWDFATFRIFFYSPVRIKRGSVELYIHTLEGSLLTRCSTYPDSAYSMSIEPGENFVDCTFPQLMLSAGSFVIGAGLAIPNTEWLYNEPNAATFEVDARDIFNSGFAPAATRYPVAMDHFWRIGETENISRRLAGRIAP